MKRILTILLPCLLILGTWGCKQEGSSSASAGDQPKAESAMDSLSMVLGDLWGSGISKNLLDQDSTANPEQILKEIEQIMGADTASVGYTLQINELFKTIEKQLGKPINKELFMTQLREGMKADKVANDDELKAKAEAVNNMMEKISPGSTHQEPTTFSTAKGTYNIESAAKDSYDYGVSMGSTRRKLYNKNSSLFKKTGSKEMDSDFKSWWMLYYGMPKDDFAKGIYQRGLKEYKRGFEDGWNY